MLCPDCQQSFEDEVDAAEAARGTAPRTQAQERQVRDGDPTSAQRIQANSSAEATPKRRAPANAAEEQALRGTANRSRVPLILVDCGHSLCYRCLCNRVEQVVVNGQGAWDRASQLSCNKCPECATKIINEDVFAKLAGARWSDQARIAETVQACYPINRALLNLRKTFAASQPAGLQPSPGVPGKRTTWPDLELQDDENEQQLNMLLEAQGDRFLEAGPSKYSDGPALVEDADDVDPDYQQMQHDYQHIQEEVHKEMQLFENRQKKITYLTQQSQDDEEDGDDGSSDDDDEETDQEDVAEEGQTDLGRSPGSKGRKRMRQQKLFELDASPQGIQNASSKRKRNEHQKCRIHPKKKIQAFCGDCKRVMCINCILDQAHKGHEMIDLNVAAQAEKQSFIEGLMVARANQTELENQILTIRNHISEIEINAQKQREKIGQIFSEVRQKIMAREQLLKKRLSEMLETEQTLYKQRIENLKDQIRCIKDLELEQAKVCNESDLTVLQRCKLRGEILADAQKEVHGQRLINCIPKIKKDEEVACIVNIILPKKLRAQLLSSKLDYQFRKIQNLESEKRKGLLRQKRDHRVTLDGSAGSVSQSSLAAGNLLSFPSGRFPHSQSNLRGRCNKERLARIHKIVLHQRLNSHQHAAQLKKLDNSQTQKSRNEAPHPAVPAEQISLQNMSPHYGAHSRLLQAQLKLQRSRERASPGLSHAVAINLVGPTGTAGAGHQDNSDSNRNSNSFDNFWSLSSMRIQNQIMRFSLGQKRGNNAAGTGSGIVGKQLKTKRANAQMAGLSVVRRLQQKDSQDTARRGQNAQGSRHNGSGLVVVPHLNMTLDQNPMTQRATRSNDKNDEIESMKTQKRGMSPDGPNAGLGHTMDNFGLAGHLSLLHVHNFAGQRADPEDLQKFKQNDKTIEQIDVVKQQASIDMAEQSLLQKIDENEEARQQQLEDLEDQHKDKKSEPVKKVQTQESSASAAPPEVAPKHTRRGKNARNSEQKAEHKVKNASKQHQSSTNIANTGADSAKIKPKVRKFNQLNYNLVPALTDRNSKIEAEPSSSNNDKKRFGHHDLAKILNDTVKPSGQQRRKDSERSGLQSPASQPSPSAPRAPANIERLTKTRLLYQDRGYSQGRSKKNKSKKEKEGNSKRHNLRACPSSQIHLKPTNEKLISSITCSNLDKTSDDPGRSLSKTRKHWKDRTSQARDRESLSPGAENKPESDFVLEATTQAEPGKNGQSSMLLSQETPHGNHKPLLIQETYYKKQHDDEQEEAQEPEKSDYGTVGRRAHRQEQDSGARSQRSSISGGPKESRSRGSLHTVQRKQWTKKNSISKRISDSILQRRGQTLKPREKESPVSMKTCEQDQTEAQSNQQDSQLRDSRLEGQKQQAQAETSKASLYQLILNQNQGAKSTNQTQHTQTQQEATARRKALQTSQLGTQVNRWAKKSKSSLSKNMKAEGTIDGAGSFHRGMTNKTIAGSSAHALVKNASSQLYQQTTATQSAIQNAQLGSSASFQQVSRSNAHSSGLLQTKVPQKSRSRAQAVRAHQQLNGSSGLKASQKKKKRATKNKKETKNVKKNDIEARNEFTEAAKRGALKQADELRNRRYIQELKQKMQEGNVKKYQGLVPPEGSEDCRGEQEEVTARELFEGVDGADEIAGSQMELGNAAQSEALQISRAQIQSSDEETDTDDEEDASMDEAELEMNSDDKMSPHRRQLDDPVRRLRSGEVQKENLRMDKLYTAAAKCKSPEPIQQIESLRRFDLTSPKKNLRGLDRPKDQLVGRGQASNARKKVESQKPKKVGAFDEKDPDDCFEDVEDLGPQSAARLALQQTLPLQPSLCRLADPSAEKNACLGRVEQKARSKSSQVQEVFSRGYSTNQKRTSKEQMVAAREKVELPVAARPLSRYSSCDFQVDDDERMDNHKHRKPRLDSEVPLDDQLDRADAASSMRRAKMSIHQSSYSIALMQPKRNQKKKVNYEGTQTMTQGTLIQNTQSERHLADSVAEGAEDEKAQGPSGQQVIKKSIQKKVIRELGVDRDKVDQAKCDQAGQVVVHGPHSNRSIGKPVLRIAEPTRAHSPLSAYSNISSSHSSKYRSVKIAPKNFGAGVNAKPTSAMDHIVSPATRSKVKKANVKSFIHGSGQLSSTSFHPFQPGLDFGDGQRVLGAVSVSPHGQKVGLFDARVHPAAAFTQDRPPTQGPSSFRTNPVAAAIAQVNLPGRSGRSAVRAEQFPGLRQLDRHGNAAAGQLGGDAEHGATTPQSGKKRNLRKARKLASIPSVQAQSRTSLPSDMTLPSHIFGKRGTPGKTTSSAAALAKPEPVGASAIGADFAASVASAQSKSELYRVKEEFLFLFGGIGSNKKKQNGINQPQSIEVMDVFREICREFKSTDGLMNIQDSGQRQNEQKIIGNEGKDCFPVLGFKAIQFKLDNAYAKANKISKFEDRIYLMGGQSELGNLLDQVHEYSVNTMGALFKAEWKLPLDLADFAVAQGTIKRSDVSESVFVAGGIASTPMNQRLLSRQVYRIFLDHREASSECRVLGTDMTTGLQYKCEQLPDMLVARSQFALVFRSLNLQDFELFAVGGVDESLKASVRAAHAIEKYSSRTKSWEAVDFADSRKADQAGIDHLVEYVSILRGHQTTLLPDGSIYIMGGGVPIPMGDPKSQGTGGSLLSYQSIVLRFDHESGSLSASELPSMNQARGFFTAVLSQNLRYIYVIGGLTNGQAPQQAHKEPSMEYAFERGPSMRLMQQTTMDVALDSIEKYDTFSSKWQLVAPMKSRRGMHAVCQMLM